MKKSLNTKKEDVSPLNPIQVGWGGGNHLLLISSIGCWILKVLILYAEHQKDKSTGPYKMAYVIMFFLIKMLNLG